MAKKKLKRWQVMAEVERRMDDAATAAAGSLSERVVTYFEGKYQALRDLRDWLAQ